MVMCYPKLPSFSYLKICYTHNESVNMIHLYIVSIVYWYKSCRFLGLSSTKVKLSKKKKKMKALLYIHFNRAGALVFSPLDLLQAVSKVAI